MSHRSEAFSVLGPSTRLTGRISGQGGLRVEGTVQGDVEVNGPAELAEGARLTGDLTAASLDLGGSLEGNVTTTGVVVVRSSAALRGEVRGAEVSIEPGAKVSIRLDTPFELDLGPFGR